MVAYGCEPGAGSDGGAGWVWTRAAAASASVTLFTQPRNVPEIERALAGRGDAGAAGAGRSAPRFDTVAVALPGPLERSARLCRLERTRYLLWLVVARRTLARHHHDRPFDLAHHVTISCDWFPVAVRRGGPRLVWGPLGAAPRPHLAALRWLGVRGAVAELARTAASAAGRRVWGRPAARRASVLLVQHPRVAERLGAVGGLVVHEPHMAIEPCANGAAVALPARSARIGEARPHAVAVARLLPWKGLAIAIAALATTAGSAWTLDVYGDGGDARRLRRLAARLGVSDRVRFCGARSRAEVLAAMRAADVLVFPGLADPSAWVVAEARSLGVPVVCIDRGWTPPMVEPGSGEAVPLTWRGLPEAFAAAMNRCAAAPRPTPAQRWRVDRLPALVRRVHELALAD